MRSNTVKVLSQLSSFGKTAYEKNITQLASVRQHLEETADVGRFREAGDRRVPATSLEIPIHDVTSVEVEGSSNLFYYLFEDYTATMPILIESKKKLDELVGVAALPNKLPHTQPANSVLSKARSRSPDRCRFSIYTFARTMLYTT